MKIRSILVLIVMGLACRAFAEKKEKLVPVDTSKSGTYTEGKWKYDYKISGNGSRSEKRSGTLTFGGKPVAPDAKANDRIKTPWGLMMLKGPGIYETGWLLKLTYDRPIDEKSGKLWPSPEEDAGKEKFKAGVVD